MAREKTYPEVVINALRNAGHRLTLARTRIVQILDQADEPLNAYEILKRLLAENTKVDVNTVYRVLETLEKCDLVTLVGLKGSDRYVAKRFKGPAIVLVQKQGVSLLSKDTCSPGFIKILDILKDELGAHPMQVTVHE